MKLTKKLETEILKVYTTYWESYSNGDIKTFAGTLDKTFEMIGTSESEICHTKEDGIKFLKAQVKELVGKVEMRNRKISVVPANELMLVNERCDIYILTDQDWRFYSTIRISTFLRKTTTGWKVFQQHGSFPDMRVQEGETLALKKINKENLQLRDAIKRRTVELEQKNRELEIETSLERVRTVAMGMKKPDDLLSICEILFKELKSLGFSELRNALIHTFVDEKRYFDDYDFSDFTGGRISHIPYNSLPFIEKFIKEIRKSNDAFTEIEIGGKELEEWKTFRKTSGQIDDPRLDSASALYYYNYSIGVGDVGISTFHSITHEKRQILKRFRNVFDLAYRRYIDIQQAEAQTRESQIQLALERVRAAAMAMHQPGDLSAIGKIIYDELKKLGFESIRNTEMIINNDRKETVTSYHNSEYGKQEVIEIDYKENPVVRKWANDLRKTEDAFVPVSIKAKEIKKWDQYRRQLGYKSDPGMAKAKAIHYYSYSIGLGAISVSTWQSLVDEQVKLLERFRNVFKLSYQRYIDIAKAEAQAREAQIEAALERVRSRSMAMHRSDELKEVIRLVLEQFIHLNIKAEHAGFYIDYKAHDDMHIWLADPNIEPFYAVIPYFDTPTWNSFLEAKAKGITLHTDLLDFKTKNKFYRSLFKLFAIPEEAKKFYLQCKGLAVSTVLLDSVGLYIENFDGTPYTDEENNILLRFGKVFQQTYTRFLDLQKAEVQAREAQIQLALERARSQSMTMQHSSELDNTLRVFHEQVLQLGIPSAFSFLWLPDEEKERHIFWAAWEEHKSFGSKAINYPLDMNEPATAQCLVDWKTKQVVSYLVNPEGVESYFAAWSELIEGAEHLKPEYFSEGLYYVEAFIKYGCFGVLVKNDLAADEKNILYRFAVEFERTYTRFLDLQKAEAQAREAQIEAALERVRSRTMAMHKSEELLEVTSLLYGQLKLLGLSLWNCGIMRLSKDSYWADIWMSRPDGKMLPGSFRIPMDKVPVYKKLYDAWKKEKPYHVEVLQGKEVAIHSRIIAELNIIPVDKMRNDAGLALPDEMIFHVFNFAEGCLGIIATGEMREPELLERFGSTFRQAYTRFLDLQKAEAQAREAQIEAALERVRSRTMAMHNSSELLPTADLLFDQLKQLGAELQGVAFAICDMNSTMVQKWTSIGVFSHPYNIDPGEERMYEAWKNQAGIYEEVYEGERIRRYYEKFMEIPAFREGLQKFIDSGYPIPEWQKNHAVTFKHGYLLFITTKPFNETQIFLRFGKVFEQTYTRFLDLQKAEAQAREAKVEMALEKIRSRTMAMQQSDELPEAANLLFLEVQALGIPAWSCGYNVLAEDKKTSDCWMSSEGAIQEPFNLYFTEEASFIEWYNFIQSDENFFVQELGGEALVQHYNYMRNIPRLGQVIKKLEDAGISLPTYQINHLCKYAYGFLLFITYEPVPDAHDLFKRFTKVFEQTYTRFLDLQKAEAQAREAQIEAALEKVRSRSLAMQKPEELVEVAELLREEMGHLGVEELETSSIYLVDKEKRQAECWYAIKDIREGNKKLVSDEMTLLLHDTRVGSEMWTFYQSDKEQASIVMKGDNRREWINYCASRSPVLRGYYGNEIPERTYHLVKFNGGYMGAASPGDISNESWDLLKRAAAVFSFAFTRFKDLQDAAARTREAQIELALERVRSQAMAMRQSADLLDIVVTMRNEFTRLGHEAHYFWYMRWLRDKYEKAMTSGDGTRIGMVMTLPRHIHGDIKLVANWEKGEEPTLVFAMDVETAVDYVDKMISLGDFERVDPQAPTLDDIRHIGGLTFIMARTMHGEIGYSLPGVVSHPPADDIKTLIRFAGVFDLAYRRFEDLKLAEQKNRETEIELALEKVRSRTMAMQKSEELGDVAIALFKELNVLVKNLWTCGFVLCEKNRSEDEWWISTESGFIPAFYLPNTADVTHENIYQGWLNGEVYHTEQLEGEALQQHYDWLMTVPVAKKIFEEMSAAGYKRPEWQKLHCAYFSKGYLCIITREPSAEEEIFKRFAQVFDLTYTRFLDLQRAEAQAREAKIEAALERVRSRTMAMQSSNELQETAAVLFEEFKKLGTEEIYQVTIGIYNEEEGLIDFRVTSWAGGGEQENRSFKLDMNEPTVLQPSVMAWKTNKKSLVIDLTGDRLEEWIQYRNKMSGVNVSSKDTLGRRVISIAYFSKGHISISTPIPVPTDTIKTLERFASVFDGTYTRFLDLEKAEAQALRAEQDLIAIKEAKQKAEDALTELQSTQKQLIQAEKMASLGELTAGIAHEIQNPLNFVNNFSEVSTELIKEMVDEVEKGNIEEVKAIASDLIGNLEKINHHGKRADGIVKGMLQHSRSSSGQKELTDINALCDEYLRLAYHGLRAKDKSFNAKFETHFDETVGKLNVIPQDIGRVVLNLINNAFYAVSERKKLNEPGYEPTVSVSTFKDGDTIRIKVRDNGTGIPQKVLDKILQPFFTTKPTGQGTGLGLSLSYDIVTKGHGGELKMETKEGEGSTFIINLPAKEN